MGMFSITAGFAICCLALFILFRDSIRAAERKLEKKHQQLDLARDDELRDITRKLDTLTESFSNVKSERDNAWPSWQRLRERCSELERMQRVWLGNANEESCREVLMDNLWVLEPNFVYQTPTKERNIDNMLRHLFGNNFSELAETDFRFIEAANDQWRPDICGWAEVGASLQPHLASERHVLLLIELKAAQVNVTRRAIEQALVYAFALMMKAEKELWGRPIECLVIGNAIADDVNDLHLRIGKSTHGAVRITPLTYHHLIKRAAINVLGYAEDHKSQHHDELEPAEAEA